MHDDGKQKAPRLLWDCGTAYDFFQSLVVLHHPARFGVRGAWTAGMRARLSSDARAVLARSQRVIHTPVHWIHALPEPKDVATALESLARTPPEKRLEALALRHDEPPKAVAEVLKHVAARGGWGKEALDVLRAHLRHKSRSHKHAPTDETIKEILAVWAQAGRFGEQYLAALRNYQEVFFAEEEERIAPALQAALTRAQARARKLPLPDLLEELSQGVRIDAPLLGVELVLAPSYWITPLVLLTSIGPSRRICLFGARPATTSLIPGETVPDTLLRALKALSDSTRLKILRYLAKEPLTPTELARRLRLRIPTVMHHLHALRLAGLVQITIAAGEEKERKCYGLRPSAPAEVGNMLNAYLKEGRR